MANELVRLANENRIATTGSPISQPVQDFMHDNLLTLAEHPTSLVETERGQQFAHAISDTEPHHENALDSALYEARYAANRSDLLDVLVNKSEVAFAETQRAAPTYDLEQSPELSAWEYSQDLPSIDM